MIAHAESIARRVDRFAKAVDNGTLELSDMGQNMFNNATGMLNLKEKYNIETPRALAKAYKKVKQDRERINEVISQINREMGKVRLAVEELRKLKFERCHSN